MVSCRPVVRRLAPALFCAAALVVSAQPARAEEPLPLAAVVERALAYDPQVRAAQAELDAARRRRFEPAEPAEARPRRRTVSLRERAADEAVATDLPTSIDASERALRRARDRAAWSTAHAALDLQRCDGLIALAQKRLVETHNADRSGAQATLIEAQAARLAALLRLESLTGSLARGVAPFEWPASSVPNPAGAEEAARARVDELAWRLRDTRANPSPDAAHALELQSIDAAHALNLARIGEQFRQGVWQHTLADAAAVTMPPVVAKAPLRPAVDPALESALAEWADAWRAKNVARYLASYAADFTPAGMDRQRWRAQRIARLTQPGPFEITIERAHWARADAEIAEVRFTQRYRSMRYADATDKRLVWRNGPGGWRIVEEQAQSADLAQRVARAPN